MSLSSLRLLLRTMHAVVLDQYPNRRPQARAPRPWPPGFDKLVEFCERLNFTAYFNRTATYGIRFTNSDLLIHVYVYTHYDRVGNFALSGPGVADADLNTVCDDADKIIHAIMQIIFR